jgi:YHS domain-containing protein
LGAPTPLTQTSGKFTRAMASAFCSARDGRTPAANKTDFGFRVKQFVRTRDSQRQTSMKKKILSLVVAILALPMFAQTASKTLVNVDDSGVAIQGYDPVAFFTDNKPVKGDPNILVKHDGAVYFFASKEHRDLFKADPAKYTPVFGGYCAYGVSRNKLVSIDVDAFQIVDGKLLLQYSKGVRDDFNKDAKNNLAKANANWTGLVAKKGK